MNKTYHSLLEQFTEESYPASFIKETIATTLRVRNKKYFIELKIWRDIGEHPGIVMSLTC